MSAPGWSGVEETGRQGVSLEVGGGWGGGVHTGCANGARG